MAITNSVATIHEPTAGTWQVKLPPWAPPTTVWLYRQAAWRCSSCGAKPQRCPHIAAVQASAAASESDAVTLSHCGHIACERVRGVPLCPGHA